MRVRATAQGFYKGRHMDPGTIFDVSNPQDFADIHSSDPRIAKFGWMEEVKEEPVKKEPEETKKGWFS